MAAPSGSPAWPSTMTFSPALTPERISTLVPSVSPICTRRRCAFPPCATKTAVSSPSRTIATAGTSDDVRVLLGVDLHLHRRAGGQVRGSGEAQAHRNRRRCRPRRPPDATAPSSRLAGVAARGGHEAAGAPTTTRGASASGTDATTSSRRGSMTRSTGSPAVGFDEIAGVVHALRDDAVECGPHDRARRHRLGGSERRLRLGERRLGVGDTRDSASSTSLRAATPRSNSSRARVWAALAFSSAACARTTSACCAEPRPAITRCWSPDIPGARAAVTDPLAAAGVRWTAFSVDGEPTVDTARAGAAAARAAGCDLVIGFGGGSALDAAKAIAALVANGGDPLDYLEVIGRGQPLTRPSLPFDRHPDDRGHGLRGDEERRARVARARRQGEPAQPADAAARWRSSIPICWRACRRRCWRRAASTRCRS